MVAVVLRELECERGGTKLKFSSTFSGRAEGKG